MNGTPGGIRLSLKRVFPANSIEQILESIHTCRKARDVEQALSLLVHVCASGLESHNIVGNSVVSLMAELGLVCNAQLLFDKQHHQNERAWTSLIAGYTDVGKSEQALQIFSRVQNDTSLQPSGHTFVALCRACSKLKDAESGRTIHAEALRMGLAETDPYVGSALIHMYAKLGLLCTAQEVLEWLPLQDAVSFTALIAGYATCGQHVAAVQCLRDMQEKGFIASPATFVCCLKACCNMGALHKGQELHAEVERLGLSCKDVVLSSALVEMYCKHGLLADAQKVFDKVSARNAVSWTSLIVGYTEQGFSERALSCYDKMLAEGISADPVALMNSLKACGKIGAIERGEDIHVEIERRGLLDTNLPLSNTLVDMYAKCGCLSMAQEVFDKLQVRSVVSWTTLLAANAEQSYTSNNVPKLLDCMQLEGVLCDAVALLCVLQACSTTGATGIGLKIHSEIERKNIFDSNPMVGNALVDMYAKNGSTSKAHEVFSRLPVRDVVSWTSLLAGHAELGESENVCRVFEQMVSDSVKPDSVTFIVVLNSCNRSGLCNINEMLYEAMNRWYGISPTLSHLKGMVGLFCRAGRLEKAISIAQNIPSSSDSIIWRMVLDACKKFGNLGLGVETFGHALLLDEKNAGAYVSISQLYAEDLFRQSKDCMG